MTETDTRTAYDAVATLYADMFSDSLAGLPLDRAMLTAFADLVRGQGPVAELGCGPGHVTAFLHSLGLDASGVDLSPAMIARARADHPHLGFTEGTMTALDLPDGGLAGALAWYSIIHLEPAEVARAFAEFHRVLAPGGHLLLGFQSGGGHEPEAFDHKVVRAYRWPVDAVADLGRRAGLTEVARMLRTPTEIERFPAGSLLLRKD
ncbi:MULTISPECIES: class I SAM-dependent DNA methyltransferase [Actinomadura]|jgi:SAM-dependent methyltransferase|uniref:Class I SAM-dependent methyltransferase n=1 Tax=Actinomadura geliboluensis TaxID=882440 RepID=A0A5S4HJT2_9ACTN|nr:class I SAM-dependent methyltransferase [Actinomadura geliboluensis]TMR39980.1 class I SAM-dependent methyltransferase [Actinomadura geliboluensis]